MEHAGQVRLERVVRLRSVAERCAGDDLCEIKESTSFLWLYGSTMVEATVEDHGEILLQAWLVIGPIKKPGWAHLVSRWDGGLPFGELVIDGDGDILLAHRISLDVPPTEIAPQVVEFCRQADRLDDILCQQLGGLRSLDQFHRDVLSAIADEALSQSRLSRESLGSRLDRA